MTARIVHRPSTGLRRPNRAADIAWLEHRRRYLLDCWPLSIQQHHPFARYPTHPDAYCQCGHTKPVDWLVCNRCLDTPTPKVTP